MSFGLTMIFKLYTLYSNAYDDITCSNVYKIDFGQSNNLPTKSDLIVKNIGLPCYSFTQLVVSDFFFIFTKILLIHVYDPFTFRLVSDTIFMENTVIRRRKTKHNECYRSYLFRSDSFCSLIRFISVMYSVRQTRHISRINNNKPDVQTNTASYRDFGVRRPMAVVTDIIVHLVK